MKLTQAEKLTWYISCGGLPLFYHKTINMKVFTTLTILATVGLCFVYGDIVISQEHKDGLLKVSKACVAETGASDGRFSMVIKSVDSLCLVYYS